MKIITAVALVFGACLVFQWRAMFHDSKFQNSPQRLPDGTVLTLLQVDYGKTNLSLDNSTFSKLRRRFVPQGVNLFGREILPAVLVPQIQLFKQAGDRELGFAIQHSPPPKSPSTIDIMLARQTSFRAIIFDEHGNEFEKPPGITMSTYSPVAGSNIHVSYWQFPAFPRESRWLSLRLYSNADPKVPSPMAEFYIRNPDPPPHPRWTGKAPQIHRKVGPLEISLSDLETGRHPDGATKAHVVRNSRASFQITEHGQPTRVWRPYNMFISDASGNRFKTEAYLPLASDPARYNFISPLKPDEPWKIEVEIARQSDFLPEDVWRIPSFRSPAGSEQRFTNHLHGCEVTVKIRALDPGQTTHILGMSHTVRVTLDGPAEGLRANVASAIDEQGREIQHGGWWAEPDSFGFHLIVPKDAEQLNLTLAVQKSLYAEFIALPKVLPLTNSARELPPFR